MRITFFGIETTFLAVCKCILGQLYLAFIVSYCPLIRLDLIFDYLIFLGLRSNDFATSTIFTIKPNPSCHYGTIGQQKKYQSDNPHAGSFIPIKNCSVGNMIICNGAIVFLIDLCYMP